ISDDIAVPDGMGGGAAVGSDHSVCTVVLDPHQGCLANLAGLRTLEGQDDDRFAVQCATLYSVCCFIQFDLFAVSVVPARFVLATQGHIEGLLSNIGKSGPGYAGNIAPNTGDPLCDSSLVASSCRTSHVPQRWCRLQSDLIFKLVGHLFLRRTAQCADQGALGNWMNMRPFG